MQSEHSLSHVNHLTDTNAAFLVRITISQKSETSPTRTGVGNLKLASQMWLFWWRYLARLIFS